MKVLTLSLLLIFCFLKSEAQDSIIFKMRYLPQRKYSSSMNIDSHTEMNISAGQEIMDKIKAKGVKMPIIIAGKSVMAYEINTGSVNESNTFPILIKYTDINSTQTVNGIVKEPKQSPLINLRIYGHSGENGKMQIDSIPGKEIGDTLKLVLSSMVKNLQNQVKFPEKPIKPGDSFKQELPMNMPIEGNNIQMVVTVTYKLIDISNNLANFDLEETANLKISTKYGELDMTGSGDGKAIYDLPNHFISSTITNLKFTYTMPVENMSIKGVATISSKHTTSISTN